MSGARVSQRRSTNIAEPVQQPPQGNIVLMGLRVVLIGCAASLLAVLAHVTWKIIV